MRPFKFLNHSVHLKRWLYWLYFQVPEKCRRTSRIREAIKVEALKPGARCLYLGANDGISGNLVYEFIVRNRLLVTFVEPVPHVFERLSRNYRNYVSVSLVEAAISSHYGQVPIYYVAKDRHKSGYDQISSFSLDLVRNQTEYYENSDDIKVVHVKGYPIAAFMGKPNHGAYTILIIDCEGYDWQIIEQLDLDEEKRRPGLIIFEHKFMNVDMKAETILKLTRHGYLCEENAGDMICALYSSSSSRIV